MEREKTIFEKIVDGEIPSIKIYEDDICIAILDKFPVVKGQSLVIPKKVTDYVFDLDDETYHHILSVSKKIAQAIDKALNPERTCLVIEGFEVPHVHIKLMPTVEPKLCTEGGQEETDENLEKVAEQIKKAL